MQSLSKRLLQEFSRWMLGNNTFIWKPDTQICCAVNWDTDTQSVLVLVGTRKCRICMSDFATDMRYKSQVWKIRRSSWTFCTVSQLGQPTVCTGTINESGITDCPLYLSQCMRHMECHGKTQWCQLSLVSGLAFSWKQNYEQRKMKSWFCSELWGHMESAEIMRMGISMAGVELVRLLFPLLFHCFHQSHQSFYPK